MLRNKVDNREQKTLRLHAVDRVDLFGARAVSWAGFPSSHADAPWYTLACFVDILRKKIDDK